LQASPFLHLQRITPKATDQEIRNFLGGFDFHNDKALDPIGDFSGGEKARLALALIVWQKPNLLLLDEPTNHLDLEMRHALTMALQDYEGALVVISHDRHLLRNTVDDFYLVADGRVAEFDGDLKDYQDWLKNFSRDIKQAEPVVVEAAVDKKLARQQSAESRKKLAPLNKQSKKLEAKIESSQRELAKVEARLADAEIYDDNHRQELKKCLSEQAAIKKTLAAWEESWLETQEQIENMTEQ